jgi:hypothetical protein
VGRGVRRVTRSTWVLDSEGLSKLLRKDAMTMARLEVAHRKGVAVKVSAMTIPEAYHGKVNRGWLSYVLSRLRVVTVTEDTAVRAADLLREHNLHGHKYAIDAVVAATAMECPRPVALYTSDVDDMGRFCAEPDRPKEDRVQVLEA